MGLISNKDRTPKVYIQYNAKTGELLTSEKDLATGARVTTAHEGVSGNLVDVRIREDKGNPEKQIDPHHKLEIELEDGGQRYVITANASVAQAVEVAARLNGADLGHPVFIGSYTVPKGSPSLKPDGNPLSEDIHGLTVRQGNGFKQRIEPFYGTAEDGTAYGRPETVYMTDDNGNRIKKGGKDMIDKDACEAGRLDAVARMSLSIVGRMKGDSQGQGQGQDDGISADDAMEAARPRQGG